MLQPSPALRSRATVAATVLITVLAFTVRLVPVLRGGGLRGVLGYDDGVYYSAADALLSGRLPYRDYLLLHPPGIVLALTPFAAIGRLTSDPTGMALARLAFMAVGALNAVLVMRIGMRAGWVAGITAGLVYACFRPVAMTERTTYLEPLVNLGILLALLFAGGVRRRWRSRPVLAGVVAGAACATKLWAGGPALLIALWLWRRDGRSGLLRYVGGAAAAAVAVCGAFVLAAPRPFVQMVLLDQLSRRHLVSLRVRLLSITGLSNLGGLEPGPHPLRLLLIGVLLVGLAAAVTALFEREARLWVALLLVLAADLLLSPGYFDHYAIHIGPGAALVGGAAVAVTRRWVVRATARAPSAAAPRVGAVVAGTVAATVVLMSVVVDLAGPIGRSLPPTFVAAAGRLPGCAVANTPVLLIETGALTRDLRHGCPLMVDPSGAYWDAHAAGSDSHAFYRNQVDAYLRGGDILLTDAKPSGRVRTSIRRVLYVRQAVYVSPRLWIYRRVAAP